MYYLSSKLKGTATLKVVYYIPEKSSIPTGIKVKSVD